MSNSSPDLIETLRTTGIWWEHEWWFEPMYLEELPREEISSNIESLKEHFDATWTRESMNGEVPNVVLANFFGQQGLNPFFTLMRLGRTMKALNDTLGLGRKLKELRGQKSHSSYFEIQIAAMFARGGYAVEFVKEGKEKTPDIIARRGSEHIAVECKRLDLADSEKWMDQLTYSLMSLSNSPHVPRDLAFQIELDERIADLRINGEETLTGSIETTIRTHIERALASLGGQVGKVQVEGIAKVRLIRTGEGEWGYIRGASRSPHINIRRVLQNGVLRALPQLPESIPGFVAVYSEIAPSPQLIRIVMDSVIDSEGHRFQDLAGIVIFQMQTMFDDLPPLAYLNRRSRHADSAVPMLESLLREQLNPVFVN